MDLDWCLICGQKTPGSLYCSEDCRFKDNLSAFDQLTLPASPTSSGVKNPTGLVYYFDFYRYRKQSPFSNPTMAVTMDAKQDTTMCLFQRPPSPITPPNGKIPFDNGGGAIGNAAVPKQFQ